ncbi:universal stress protein MT2085 [Nematostella vectensis]|uniref:universal stress protein MT2085 n=1 Tax=Nematostella vectensis TaxID=45351 RepID=UPI00138FDFA3|nr:universal stress protein MT2085 [Nematostella vectensis]
MAENDAKESAEKKGKAVLVAVDQKSHSKFAYEYYCQNIHKPGDDLTIYYCHKPLDEPADPYTRGSFDFKQKKKHHEEERDQMIKIYTGECKKRGISAHIKVDEKHKKAGEGILDCAIMNSADMIVLGCHKELSSIRRHLLGGVSDHVMHQAKVPILIVHEGGCDASKDNPHKRVMLAVDGKLHSKNAFKYYCDNIRKDDDEVYLYFCHKHLEEPADPYAKASEEFKVKKRQHEDERNAVIDSYKAECKDRQISAHIKVDEKHRKTGEGICEHATTNNADMLVMGSRGLSSIRRYLLGGTSDHVLHHVKTPLLIIPEP